LRERKLPCREARLSSDKRTLPSGERSFVLLEGSFVLLEGSFVLLEVSFVLLEGSFVLLEGSFVLLEGSFLLSDESLSSWSEQLPWPPRDRTSVVYSRTWRLFEPSGTRRCSSPSAATLRARSRPSRRQRRRLAPLGARARRARPDS